MKLYVTRYKNEFDPLVVIQVATWQARVERIAEQAKLLWLYRHDGDYVELHCEGEGKEFIDFLIEVAQLDLAVFTVDVEHESELRAIEAAGLGNKFCVEVISA